RRQGLHNLSTQVNLNLQLKDWRLARVIRRGERILGSGASRWDVEINQLFQFLARLEIGYALSRDTHGIAGFGIPAAASTAFSDTEATESAELNFFTVIERLDNAFENDFD